MNIDFVERLVKTFISGNRKDLILALEELQKQESKKKHKNNVQRLKNLIKIIPSKGFVVSSLNLTKASDQKQSTLFEYISPNLLLEETVLEKDVKSQVSDFLFEWENYSKLKKHGVFPTNKLLFYGAPGTGKTNLAYGIANKLGVPLILVRLDEVISSYLGKTGKNIREIFDIAERENVVLFLDEIDTLAKQRDDSSELGELKRVVTVLLQNIDRFPSNSIMIGATNHEKILDNAIWRRFQMKVEFKEPSSNSRKAMFKMYLGSFISDDLLDLLAAISDQQTGSVIRDVSQKLKKAAILNNQNTVTVKEIATVFSLTARTKDTKLSAKAKDDLYKLCKLFVKHGMNIKEVSELAGIPYSTLRDNIKKK